MNRKNSSDNKGKLDNFTLFDFFVAYQKKIVSLQQFYVDKSVVKNQIFVDKNAKD